MKQLWSLAPSLAFWFLADVTPPRNFSSTPEADKGLLGAPVSGSTISKVFKAKDDVLYQTYLMEVLTYHYLFTSARQVMHWHTHTHTHTHTKTHTHTHAHTHTLTRKCRLSY